MPPRPSLIIGITGRIATGKSTFTRSLGAHLIKAGIPTAIHSYDRVRADLLEIDLDPQARATRTSLATEIGLSVSPQNRFVDRRELAQRLAEDSYTQALHDQIVEPIVRERIVLRMRHSAHYFHIHLVEWACIIDRNAWELAQDGIILMSCKEETQHQRLLGGDLPESVIAYRLQNQSSEADLLCGIHGALDSNLVATSWRIVSDGI
jgi:dephospho-CoA kinase